MSALRMARRGRAVAVTVAQLLVALTALSLARPAHGAYCADCCQDIAAGTNGAQCNHPSPKDACGQGGTGEGCQNGCGPSNDTIANLISGWNNFVAGTDSFTPACNDHDECYNTCGSDPKACDQKLQNELDAVCAARFSGFAFLFCELAGANVNATFVRFQTSFGAPAWQADQALHCTCCDSCPSPPPNVDLGSDPSNCGACGNACGAGQSCSSGQCTCDDASSTLCGKDCVDTNNDPANCGACGHACAQGQQCQGGACLCGNLACADGQKCCPQSLCASILSDPANCGDCGVQCDPGKACVSGVCQCGSTVCSAQQTCCNSACTNLQIDNLNCGSCGNPCPPGVQCAGGTCQGCSGVAAPCSYSGTISGSSQGLTYTGTVQLTQYVYETSDTLAYYHITGSAKVTTPTPYGGVTCTISPSSGPISTNTTAGDLIVNPGPAGTFPADGYTIRWALDWSATFSCVDSSGKQLPDFTIPIPVDYATLDCGAPHYMLYSDINHLAGSLTMCGGNQGTWDLTAQ